MGQTSKRADALYYKFQRGYDSMSTIEEDNLIKQCRELAKEDLTASAIADLRHIQNLTGRKVFDTKRVRGCLGMSELPIPKKYYKGARTC